MNVEAVAGVPGLFLQADYFSPDLAARLVAESVALYRRLETQVGRGDQLETVSIPQPAYVRSQEHNLPSEERFTQVSLEEISGRTVRCEYFPRYGEDGHALAYFQRNNNLPDFVADDLLPGIEETIQNIGLVESVAGLVWKLTMNFYRTAGDKVAGFPFHVDIPSNGVVTMILNIHREARFQIARDGKQVDLVLPVGGLLILSGESRYEWKHRVLPGDVPDESRDDLVQRVSLVLGYQ